MKIMIKSNNGNEKAIIWRKWNNDNNNENM